MFMIVVAIVMAGTGIHVILGGGFKAKPGEVSFFELDGDEERAVPHVKV